MVFAMALVLAWLLISCVARCTLCTSLNRSESVYSSAKCGYQHTSPFYAHLQQALNGIRPGGKNRHTMLVLSDSPKQGHLPHFQKYGQCYQLTIVVKQKQVPEVPCRSMNPA